MNCACRRVEGHVLFHPGVPAGPIPATHDPEAIYPYEAMVETARRPVLKPCRSVILENERLRATVCPDLGGRLHSLYDKQAGRETLFVPVSLCPVRILPRLAFIPGGIEFSFPISHTPVQLEPVHCRTGRWKGRVLVWCGERELHSGLNWTVEYSLGPQDAFLTQRVYLANQGSTAQPWMSWSNAAVPARPDSEFHFPGGPVLRHADTLQTIRWEEQGPRTLAEVRRMTGYFWQEPDTNAFGVFTPSLGGGLYHLADPACAPGVKLWAYGLGRDLPWARAASLNGETYVELQGGPLRDQSLRPAMAPGKGPCYVEFWLPASQPLDIRHLAVPKVDLPPEDKIPLFSWPPRAGVDRWLRVFRAWAFQRLGTLPPAPGLGENEWAPRGIESLGPALAWAAERTGEPDRSRWLLQLGAWQAARGQCALAIQMLARSSDDRAPALAGRLLWRGQGDPQRGAEAYRRLRNPLISNHPQVVVERDACLGALGPSTLEEREAGLAPLAASTDEWVIERRATWLADAGRWAEAKALLECTPFQLVHQRYERTRLWRRVKTALGIVSEDPPGWLGEDDLASFGAYRQFEADRSKPPGESG